MPRDRPHGERSAAAGARRGPESSEEHIAPKGRALYAAVSGGHHAIAQLLLENGANPNQAVESSADALSIAMMHKDQKMVDLLRSYGASRNVELQAYYDDLEAAETAFAANPALADDPGALCTAAGNGNQAFVRLMLKYQPDLAHRVSCAGGTRELTELLFRHGMSPSRPSWLLITPLHQFARVGTWRRPRCSSNTAPISTLAMRTSARHRWDGQPNSAGRRWSSCS
jgi:hypothetical protein